MGRKAAIQRAIDALVLRANCIRIGWLNDVSR